MVLHKKHQILKTIRTAILKGDSLIQAKSLCIHKGFGKRQIKETLNLYDEFKKQVDFKNEDFWQLLSYEVFDLATRDTDFEQYLDSIDEGIAIFDLRETAEPLKPVLNKFRLLDICKYSGYRMFITLPNDHIQMVKTSKAIINVSQFEEILAKKKALGLEGELFVLKEEQLRLGIDFTVEHTSQINVGAGYDIQSWKNDKSFSKSNQLFVEVKTISIKKEIYLTENEIETAKKLGVNYRLHIVRKVQSKLLTYKVIDDFHTFFEKNKTDFIVKPTYLLKV